MSELAVVPRGEETSEPVSELFLEPPPLVARGLVYLLVSLVLAALVYATVGRVNELARAGGALVPRGLSRPVQAAVGGRVTQVAVQEGERVAAGQALVYLETEAARAQLDRAEQEDEIRQRQVQELLASGADSLQVAEARAGEERARAELDAARRALDASILVAPVDGQLTRLTVRGMGETVNAGQVVGEVAPPPDEAPPLFQARLPNHLRGRVREGQRALVKLDAFPHQRYGVLDGVVEYVASDAIGEGPDTGYRVLVGGLRSRGGRIPARDFRLGLSGTAEIVTSRPRLIELFFRTLRGESGSS